MKEALAQVRRDLGGDAVILATREVRRRRLFGLGTRDLIEVTAAATMPLEAAVPHEATVVDSAAGGAGPDRQRPDRHFRPVLRPVSASSSAGCTRWSRPEPAGPDRSPAARPPRRAGADLRAADRGRRARGAGPAAGPACRRPPRAGRAFELRGDPGALCEAVEQCIPTAPPIRAVPGTRRVVALVGPTGVGKTTTVAKLAANFKLAHGLPVGLVTVDTYRIAAVEQLRTYAEIIDLPLAVANDPAEMRRAIDELGTSTWSSSTPPGGARATRSRSASWPTSWPRPGPTRSIWS